MKNISDYFGKTIKVHFGLKESFSIINVIGFDASNDVILETLEQHYPNQKPKKYGFYNPYTVDKLWFKEELTGRKITILN